MKPLGIILLLAAFAIGVFWPRVQLEILGSEVGTIEFYRPSVERPATQALELSVADNPVLVQMQAVYLIDGRLPPIKIPARILISDSDGVFLNGVVSFPTTEINEGAEQPTSRASQPIKLNVLNSGEHHFLVYLERNENDGGVHKPDVKKITLTVTANAPEFGDDLKALAAVLFLAGVYILLRSRKRKGKAQQVPRRWGRE